MTSNNKTSTGPVARVLIVAIAVYKRWIAPFLPPACRFYPSCSAYATEALAVHGAGYGSWLALRRLLRCGPWHPGGLDPVPPRRTPDSVLTATYHDSVHQFVDEE